MKRDKQRRYRLRFNLQRGVNYLHWEILDLTSSERKYFNPETTSFVLKDCFLFNNKKAARKIFNKISHKFVVAYIEVDDYSVLETFENQFSKNELSYNPHKKPYWVFNEMDVDGYVFPTINIEKGKLFV